MTDIKKNERIVYAAVCRFTLEEKPIKVFALKDHTRLAKKEIERALWSLYGQGLLDTNGKDWELSEGYTLNPVFSVLADTHRECKRLMTEAEERVVNGE